MANNKQLADKLAKKLKEISGTGTGASYTPGSGIQTAEPFVNFATHKSNKKPYFYKLGYKLAPHQVEEANPGASLGKGPKAGPTGVKNNAYTKQFGFKPVDSKKLAKNAKWVDTKYLWKEDQTLSEDTNIEEYINTLSIESPELKKFISSRILGFDTVENKLNELLPLLQKAKQKTMDEYKQNPSFNVLYGTDLAADYLDDLIEMFKD
jgi:hypothetical protein